MMRSSAAGSTARWRAGLIALCVLGLALVAHEAWVFSGGLAAESGVVPVGTAGRAYLQKIQVAPKSAAERAGLRSGEVIDVRPMSPLERYRFYNLKYRGQHNRVFVLRGGRLSQISIVARTDGTWDWILRFGVAGNVWMLLFGGLLAWKRADSAGARTLSLLFILVIIAIAIAPFGDSITPWPAVDAVAQALWGLLQAAVPLLCVYAMLFAKPPSLVRKVLAWLAYLCAGLSVTVVLAQVLGALTGTLFFFSVGFLKFASVVFAMPWLFTLSCGVATAIQTRGLDRTRFLWGFAPIALLYVAETSNGLGVPFANAFWLRAIYIALNAALFLAPLGLTYSLLSRRLLDIGFALNRAAVFSGVSVVIVGLFVLVEWLLSDWMQRVSHSTSIIVSGALALVLGLSIRFVHGKVEHVVDNVMFRKRREDEEAIRRMAREAPYITERETLLDRVVQTLQGHAGASSVRVLLDDGSGRYGGVSENDPALVTLRAEHARVDLHAMQTALEGEWAYPMAARGRLAGALVLGPKTSGESYAPDESAAIAQLAHGVAGALDVFDTKGQASDVRVMFAQILSAISRLSKPEVADV